MAADKSCSRARSNHADEFADVEQLRVPHPAAHSTEAGQQRTDGDVNVTDRNVTRFVMFEEADGRMRRAVYQQQKRRAVDKGRHAPDGLPAQLKLTSHTSRLR